MNFDDLEKIKISNLKKWRERYSEEEYPYKVLLNMFYDLFAMEYLIKEANFFFGLRKADKFDEAVSLAYFKKKEIIQKTNLISTLEQLMNNNVKVAGIRFNDYANDLHLAKDGNNDSVTEIEYAYWFYSKYCDIIIYWLALGAMGFTKQQAFYEISGGAKTLINFTNLEEIILEFNKFLGVTIQLKNRNDEIVVFPFNSTEKLYPIDFEILPDLFSNSI